MAGPSFAAEATRHLAQNLAEVALLLSGLIDAGKEAHEDAQEKHSLSG